jgi:hypothetical protein
VAVAISNEPAISALGVTAERHRWRQLIVAVGDIHTAESFPDSLASHRGSAALSARLFGAPPLPSGAVTP